MLLLFGAGNVIAQKSAGSEQPVEEKQLIVKIKLPSECTVSPLYEIVMVTQFLLQISSALVAGMLNALIMTLVSWFRIEEFWKSPIFSLILLKKGPIFSLILLEKVEF